MPDPVPPPGETDRLTDVWGARTPHDRSTAWPDRVDVHLDSGVTVEQVDRWVQSACVLCSNGCGCDIAVKDGVMVGVRGRGTDTVNRGRLGPKGLYGSTPWASAPDRLRSPLIRHDGVLVECDWDTAMGRIVEVSKDLLDRKGPLSHGFYTSGQLFAEEYYTLAVIGKAGLGTPHMDGNTRLCTATAAAALKESFGADGQPGCYADIEHCDAVFLFGHNMPETQTVLWARILDRTRGADPPVLVCVDPRRTQAAVEAERTGGVHLAVKVGTNLALINGLTRELFVNDWVDQDWVAAHTIGVDALRTIVEPYTPDAVARICGIEADQIRRAAQIFGQSRAVLSTVLQGFYQSHQATAAAVGVNNLHLLRGMLGRPGAGLLQMNGQPTAQNNRECGADGDLPGFRNWDNTQHVQELANLWNVDPMTIPHWAEPTHAMQIFGYAEDGTIGLLWISATNPAVSMPESARIRRILGGRPVFRRGPGLVSHRNCAAGRRRAAGRRMGGEDRCLHQRQPHRAPVRAGGTPARSREIGPGHLPVLRRRDGLPRPGRATPDPVADTRAGLRGMEGRLTWSAGRLHRAELPETSWPVAASRGRSPTRRRTAPSGSTPTPTFPTGTEECETYGHDLAHRRSGHPGAAPGAAAGRSGPAEGLRIHPRPRGTQRRIPAAVHHRPDRLPVPHPHQDRAVPPTTERRPASLG